MTTTITVKSSPSITCVLSRRTVGGDGMGDEAAEILLEPPGDKNEAAQKSQHCVFLVGLVCAHLVAAWAPGQIALG